MNKNINIEEQINLTFKSINGIRRAKSSTSVFSTIQNNLNEKSGRSRTEIFKNSHLKYAFIIALLIIINIFTIYRLQNYETNNNQKTDTPSAIIDDYNLEYNLTYY